MAPPIRHRHAPTRRASRSAPSWRGVARHALCALACALSVDASNPQTAGAQPASPPGAESVASAPSVEAREAFRGCDAQAFLVLNIARNYMMTGRNRDTVMPHLRGDASAEALAEEVLGRIDAGQVHHPGELAADTLFRCAAERRIDVGAPRQRVALCFTRTDVAFFLHVERSDHVVRQKAVSKVSARLSSRELYPMALINQVAEAVYSPTQLPDLRQLMGRVAWACIHQRQASAGG